jgi:hypothetical protein
MTAVQEKTVGSCKCPHCDQYCSNDIRPYVCACGAVFGKNGWVTTITVKRNTKKSLHDYQTRKAIEGRKAWSKLHRIEHGTPELFEDFKKYMPGGCECKKKVDAILKKIPPRYGSPPTCFGAIEDLAPGKPELSSRWQTAWSFRRYLLPPDRTCRLTLTG